MKIAKQGWRYVSIGLAAALLGAACPIWEGKLFAVLGLGFAGFCCYFFRDPERVCPADSGKIYSPGDGKVLSVAKEGPGGETVVRIFLSIFDVHIQRVPCSGTVEGIQYIPGSFAMAMKPEANQNERNIVRIVPDGGKGAIEVEQIAGLIARRIECWIQKGRNVSAGERYGLIRFGSQAAVRLPAGARPAVSPGDRVAGGVTVIAEWIKTN